MHIIIRYVFKGSVYIFYPRPQNDPDSKTIMMQLFFANFFDILKGLQALIQVTLHAKMTIPDLQPFKP